VSLDPQYQEMSKLALLAMKKSNSFKFSQDSQHNINHDQHTIEKGTDDSNYPKEGVNNEKLIETRSRTIPESGVAMTSKIKKQQSNLLEGLFKSTVADSCTQSTQVELHSGSKSENTDESIPTSNNKRDKKNVETLFANVGRGIIALNLIVDSNTNSSTSDSKDSPETRFEKYSRMKKNMVPEGAITQRMLADGFTAQEIEQYFRPASAKFDKYEQMKKILPEAAVMHKMRIDGISDEEISSFFKVASSVPARSEEVGLPPGIKPKANIKPSKPLKSFFWDKIGTAELKNTIWVNVSEVDLNNHQMGELEKLFINTTSIKHSTEEAKTAVATKTIIKSNVQKFVSIVDAKLSRTVEIILSRLKRQPSEIANWIVEVCSFVILIYFSCLHS
jgi:hypothetical protein